MNLEQAREFVARNQKAVLATLKRDGRPQLSNISYTLDYDGRIKISTSGRRAKAHNLRRDPRASLAIQSDNWHEYVVVEGTATIIEDNVLPELHRIYERIRKAPHPNWQEFDEAMIRDQRVIIAITVDRLYPVAS